MGCLNLDYFETETCYNETGFYYLKSRYYDPQIGRFISPDDPSTLMLTIGTPFATNLYAYALNNPLKYYDPSGMIFKKIGKMVNKAVNTVANAVANFAMTVANTTAVVYDAVLGWAEDNIFELIEKVSKPIDKVLDSLSLVDGIGMLDKMLNNYGGPVLNEEWKPENLFQVITGTIAAVSFVTMVVGMGLSRVPNKRVSAVGKLMWAGGAIGFAFFGGLSGFGYLTNG